MLLQPIAIDAGLKTAWEDAVNESRLAPDDIAALVALFRRTPPTPAADAVSDDKLADALWASVIMARVAFALPEAGLVAYDRLAERYLDGVPMAFTPRELGDDVVRRLATPARLAPELPPYLWALLEGGVDPEQITARVAALGAAHPVALRDACARAMLQHPGVDEFRRRPPMPRLTMEHLTARAAGTLGETLHRLIVDNGYDLDVLDPETVKGYHPRARRSEPLHPADARDLAPGRRLQHEPRSRGRDLRLPARAVRPSVLARFPRRGDGPDHLHEPGDGVLLSPARTRGLAARTPVAAADPGGLAPQPRRLPAGDSRARGHRAVPQPHSRPADGVTPGAFTTESTEPPVRACTTLPQFRRHRSIPSSYARHMRPRSSAAGGKAYVDAWVWRCERVRAGAA
jgi:hypothetical protein